MKSVLMKCFRTVFVFVLILFFGVISCVKSTFALQETAVIAETSNLAAADYSEDPVAIAYYEQLGVAAQQSSTGVFSITPFVVCSSTYGCVVRSYTVSNMKQYYQNGQSWSSNGLNGCPGSTIGGSGCGITAVAMIASKYGSTDTPADVNNRLGSAACPLAYATVASVYGLTYNILAFNQNYSQDGAKSLILGALSVGRPVLIYLKNGSSTHFVVAESYTEYENGHYIFGIKNPWNGSGATLASYTSSGYTISHIIPYYR